MPKQPRGEKPSRPYPEYPLFAHAAGVWAKKIRGKLHYFGPWSDPQAALQKYLDTVDDLQAGRKPKPKGGGLTIRHLANHFLTHKQSRLRNGELSADLFESYRRVCGLLVEHLGGETLVSGLQQSDLSELRQKLSQGRGLQSLHDCVRRAKAVFRYASDADLIDKPVKFGVGFASPTADSLARERAGKPSKLFAPEELRVLLERADPVLRCWILLGVNAAFGPSDLSGLPRSAVDLKGGWVTFPRPKTGVPRRAKLWPETVDALRAALPLRPAAADPDDDGLAFLDNKGRRLVHHTQGKGRMTLVRHEMPSRLFKTLLLQCGLWKPGRSFYGLRHTFRTVGDETLDGPGLDLIMGHSKAGDIASRYRGRIGDDRLERIAAHVRTWLFNT